MKWVVLLCVVIFIAHKCNRPEYLLKDVFLCILELALKFWRNQFSCLMYTNQFHRKILYFIYISTVCLWIIVNATVLYTNCEKLFTFAKVIKCHFLMYIQCFAGSVWTFNINPNWCCDHTKHGKHHISSKKCIWFGFCHIRVCSRI